MPKRKEADRKQKPVQKRAKGKPEKTSDDSEFNNLLEALDSMRNVLTYQVMQTATLHVQQGVASNNPGDIVKLAEAITKLAEATRELATLRQDNPTPAPQPVALVKAEPLDTDHTKRLTRQDKIRIQEFLDGTLYECEITDTQLQQAFPSLDLQVTRKYCSSYLMRLRSRKSTEIYETISAAYPKFSCSELPSNNQLRIVKLKEMLKCDKKASQDDVTALLKDCVGIQGNLANRAYTLAVISCIVRYCPLNMRRSVYENMSQEYSAMYFNVEVQELEAPKTTTKTSTTNDVPIPEPNTGSISTLKPIIVSEPISITEPKEALPSPPSSAAPTKLSSKIIQRFQAEE